MRLLSALIVIVALLVLDRVLEPRDSKRSSLAGLRHQAARLEEKRGARVAVLGSSTIGQWLTPDELGRLLKVPPNRILDASLSACYSSCTWSVVKQLLAQKRHFDELYVGVNLFSMCEGGPELRVMQSVELTPVNSIPELLINYAYSPRRTVYWGGWAAMNLSQAYRDVTYIQSRAANWAFGKKANSDLWRLSKPTAGGADRDGDEPGFSRCAYTKDKVALQTRFLDRLLSELSDLGSHVYLLSLPQRSLSLVDTDEKIRASWDAHRSAIQEISRRHAHVTLLDMTGEGVARKTYFRDAIHLSAAGARYQSKHFSRLLHRVR